jgi:hypothetical protein
LSPSGGGPLYIRAMKFFGFLTAAVLALAISGCKKDESASKDAGHQPVTSPNLPLGEKLTFEAQHRPAGAVTADQVYAALDQQGIAITEKQQHVAAPFLAQYCLGAHGPAGIALSVCEFSSEEAAVAGKKESETALSSVPNRTLAQKGKTVITVREPQPPTDESKALRERIVAAFMAL